MKMNMTINVQICSRVYHKYILFESEVSHDIHRLSSISQEAKHLINFNIIQQPVNINV